MLHSKNKKGQSVVMEEMCVVFFGILILITVITVFSIIRDNTSGYVVKLQFENIGNYVHNGVVNSYINGRFKSDNYTVLLNLPSRAAGYGYSVSVDNNTYILVSDIDSALEKSVKIYNLDPNLTISGTLSSTASGAQMIIYDPNNNHISLDTVK